MSKRGEQKINVDVSVVLCDTLSHLLYSPKIEFATKPKKKTDMENFHCIKLFAFVVVCVLQVFVYSLKMTSVVVPKGRMKIIGTFVQGTRDQRIVKKKYVLLFFHHLHILQFLLR